MLDKINSIQEKIDTLEVEGLTLEEGVEYWEDKNKL